MSGTKKAEEAIFANPMNVKIQQKFDLIFGDGESTDEKGNNKNSLKDADVSLDFDVFHNEDTSMNEAPKKVAKPQIDLQFSVEEDFELEGANDKTVVAKSSIDDLPKKIKEVSLSGIELDFELNDGPDRTLQTVKESVPTSLMVNPNTESNNFELTDFEISEEVDRREQTQKTIVIDRSKLHKLESAEINPDSILQEPPPAIESYTNTSTSNVLPAESMPAIDLSLDALTSIDIDSEFSSSPSLDVNMMSTERSRDDIELSINDIVGDKNNVVDIDAENVISSDLDFAKIEDTKLAFENTPSKGFLFEDLKEDEATKFLTNSTDDSFGRFSLETEEFTRNFKAGEIKNQTLFVPDTSHDKVKEKVIENTEVVVNQVLAAPANIGVSLEDSIRVQATIRALREERDELLSQIKMVKGDNKEVQQDNLTLKANLDEAKIEISILRKRHLTELEDLKYRLSMSEEKKALADEKAHQADLRKEKLEQKVRVDFNQIKQREKELENKLELLSMDVEAQIQSRDQKILELRRKIDALEFNMENVSIKEQKSFGDKRKMEDRLNKIMNTLRYSIKNIEEDIEQSNESDNYQKEKN